MTRFVIPDGQGAVVGRAKRDQVVERVATAFQAQTRVGGRPERSPRGGQGQRNARDRVASLDDGERAALIEWRERPVGLGHVPRFLRVTASHLGDLGARPGKSSPAPCWNACAQWSQVVTASW